MTLLLHAGDAAVVWKGDMEVIFPRLPDCARTGLGELAEALRGPFEGASQNTGAREMSAMEAVIAVAVVAAVVLGLPFGAGEAEKGAKVGQFVMFMSVTFCAMLAVIWGAFDWKVSLLSCSVTLLAGLAVRMGLSMAPERRIFAVLAFVVVLTLVVPGALSKFSAGSATNESTVQAKDATVVNGVTLVFLTLANGQKIWAPEKEFPFALVLVGHRIGYKDAPEGKGRMTFLEDYTLQELARPTKAP